MDRVAGCGRVRDVAIVPAVINARLVVLDSSVGVKWIKLDDAVATAAFEQCKSLGCSFYDALAPAIAARSGAALVSADVRARSGFGGVVLLGA